MSVCSCTSQERISVTVRRKKTQGILFCSESETIEQTDWKVVFVVVRRESEQNGKGGKKKA
jgi:hypothetical protein